MSAAAGFCCWVCIVFSESDYFKLGCVYIKLYLLNRAFFVALYRHSFDVTCKNIHNLLFYVHFFSFSSDASNMQR